MPANLTDAQQRALDVLEGGEARIGARTDAEARTVHVSSARALEDRGLAEIHDDGRVTAAAAPASPSAPRGWRPGARPPVFHRRR